MESISKTISIKSDELGKELELKIFGKYGFTFLAFPSFGDNFHEELDMGFVQSVADYLFNGLFRIVYVPTVENRIWKNQNMSLKQRSELHWKYNNFLINEVLPNLFRIAGSPSPIITFGCGEAGYFAANTYFRHPDIVYGTISIDGFFDIRHLRGNEEFDDNCYFNSPVDFLPNLNDEYWLIHLRAKKQVHLIATDRDNNSLAIEECRRMAGILAGKGITSNVEILPPQDDNPVINWQKIFSTIVSRYF